MKLIAQVKLLPTPEQADALRRTLEQANAACQFVSNTAWETKTFRQYDLHHKCYRAVREQFGLSAQVAVRAIAKVADAYKLDRKAKRTFKPKGSIAYDDRILSWRLQDQTVSIWTVNGQTAHPLCVWRDVSWNCCKRGKEKATWVCTKGCFSSRPPAKSMSQACRRRRRIGG